MRVTATDEHEHEHEHEHGHAHAHAHEDGEVHIVPLRIYILVFLALLLGTWLTVLAAGVDFGRYNLVVALAIAVTKATLVVLFFMHVKYSGRLIHIVLMTTLGALILLMTIVSDYYTPRTSGHVPDHPTLTRE